MNRFARFKFFGEQSVKQEPAGKQNATPLVRPARQTPDRSTAQGDAHAQHPPGHHSESAYPERCGYRMLYARKKSTLRARIKVADDERDGKRGHGVTDGTKTDPEAALSTSSEARSGKARPLAQCLFSAVKQEYQNRCRPAAPMAE